MATRDNAAVASASVALDRSSAGLWLGRRVLESTRCAYEAKLDAAQSSLQVRRGGARARFLLGK
jgi:hypothetical protein